ncbi:MAG: 50S ribosomal protein L17 [Phycisphaerae bacterium]|nr:50S ribosomal protein L17 [Phycisphaerae bacterium]
MRHRVAGKQLSRSTSHRRALRRNMAASLIEHEAIRTTEAKAKELRRFVERIITLAKKGTLHARRRVIAEMGDRNMVGEEGELLETTIVGKLFSEIAARYADRPGGYTRIIRISERRIGDSGVQVLLQLVGESDAEAAAETKISRRKRRAAKRHEATATVEEQEEAPAEQPEQAEQQAAEEAEQQAEADSSEAKEDKKT